jgi:hypothetical protein
MLIGTYVIVHDGQNGLRGACRVLPRGPAKPSLEEVVSFRIPRGRKRFPASTTVISKPAFRIDTFDTLSEFQFAGDSEGHGVPIGGLASDPGTQQSQSVHR